MSSFFEHEGHRLAYTVHGDGPRTTVLIHGLLFTQALNEHLADELAGRGHRVVTMDLLGHGASDRPEEMQAYSMQRYGAQVIALLDHLGIEKAVIGGMSLGANTALEAAALAPERVQGMVIEMPVLDNALVGCALAFTPVMVAMTLGEPVMRGLQALAKRVPPLGWFPDQLVDLVRQDPRPSGALLQGLFFARIAPPREVRRTMKAPTLIIGHPHDPVHPFSDSGALHDELENSTLVRAGHILELRLSPERLTGEIAGFLDAVWADAAPAPRKRARAAAEAA